jgi:hypothetical protein
MFRKLTGYAVIGVFAATFGLGAVRGAVPGGTSYEVFGKTKVKAKGGPKNRISGAWEDTLSISINATNFEWETGALLGGTNTSSTLSGDLLPFGTDSDEMIFDSDSRDELESLLEHQVSEALLDAGFSNAEIVDVDSELSEVFSALRTSNNGATIAGANLLQARVSVDLNLTIDTPNGPHTVLFPFGETAVIRARWRGSRLP